MKVWTTKWWKTKGVLEVDVLRQNEYEATIRSDAMDHRWISRTEMFKTREEAVARAEELRARWIASLRKQIAALEAMKFDAS
jgi:hypothetical protein